MIRRQ